MNFRRLVHLFILIHLLLGCKQPADKEGCSLVFEKSRKSYNFDTILKCGYYDYGDGYFITVDKGCVYPHKKNNYGNIMIYLIPKDENIRKNVEDYNGDVNKISLSKMKNDFTIFIFLIPNECLDKTPEGYYRKDKYTVETFVYNDKHMKWNYIVSKSFDSEQSYKWEEEFIKYEILKIQKSSNSKYTNLYKSQNISKKWQGKYHYLDEEGRTAGGDWTGHYTNYRITKDSVHLTTSGHMSGREDYYLAEEKGDTLMLYRYQDIRNNNSLYKQIEQEKLYKKGDTYYFLVNEQEKKGVKIE